MFDPDHKVVSFFGTPMCTDKETYAAWREAARKSFPGEAGFCTDCTPDYQAEMITAGRCENPWIEFDYQEGDAPPPSTLTEEGKVIFKMSDKGIVGYVPQAVKQVSRHRNRGFK